MLPPKTAAELEAELKEAHTVVGRAVIALLGRGLSADDVGLIIRGDEGTSDPAEGMRTTLQAIAFLSRPGYPPPNAAEIVAEIHHLATHELESGRPPVAHAKDEE